MSPCGSGKSSGEEPSMAAMTVRLLCFWLKVLWWSERLTYNSGQSKWCSAGKDVCLFMVVVMVKKLQMWLLLCYSSVLSRDRCVCYCNG